jgi:chemotaxis protein methyltransferase CheR
MVKAPSRVEPAAVSEGDLAKFCLWVRDTQGYDFTDYQVEPLRKSLQTLLRKAALNGIPALLDELKDGRRSFAQVLSAMTITTSSMFRNPEVFATLRKEVFPYLETYQRLKIWHAGCAQGEEVYSLAILLHEHGLLSRTMIYATDINPLALERAKEGIYPARRIKEFAKAYFEAGGAGNLVDYFELKYDRAKFSRALTRRVLFSKHDLVSDRPFGEMQLILCRNVLIYFNRPLQQKTYELFRDSLSPRGFLCLGQTETLPIGPERDRLTPFASRLPIFRLEPAGERATFKDPTATAF